MPTPKEYRLRAHECLELTNKPNEWYVKAALLDLAAEFQKRAEKLESAERTALMPVRPGAMPRAILAGFGLAHQHDLDN